MLHGVWTYDADGIQNRDMKRSNVLVDGWGGLKLADNELVRLFGIAATGP